jgi:hypothetical protein
MGGGQGSETTSRRSIDAGSDQGGSEGESGGVSTLGPDGLGLTAFAQPGQTISVPGVAAPGRVAPQRGQVSAVICGHFASAFSVPPGREDC